MLRKIIKTASCIFFCNLREAEKEVLGRDEDEEMLDGEKEESDSSDTEYTDSEEDTGETCIITFFYERWLMLIYILILELS